MPTDADGCQALTEHIPNTAKIRTALPARVGLNWHGVGIVRFEMALPVRCRGAACGAGLGGRLTAEFEVGFVGANGAETRASLIDSVGMRFELARPVRGFPSYKRQRNFPGLWWSSTNGRHVGCESWLERT